MPQCVRCTFIKSLPAMYFHCLSRSPLQRIIVFKQWKWLTIFHQLQIQDKDEYWGRWHNFCKAYLIIIVHNFINIKWNPTDFVFRRRPYRKPLPHVYHWHKIRCVCVLLCICSKLTKLITETLVLENDAICLAICLTAQWMKIIMAPSLYGAVNIR